MSDHTNESYPRIRLACCSAIQLCWVELLNQLKFASERLGRSDVSAREKQQLLEIIKEVGDLRERMIKLSGVLLTEVEKPVLISVK